MGSGISKTTQGARGKGEGGKGREGKGGREGDQSGFRLGAHPPIVVFQRGKNPGIRPKYHFLLRFRRNLNNYLVTRYIGM